MSIWALRIRIWLYIRTMNFIIFHFTLYCFCVGWFRSYIRSDYPKILVWNQSRIFSLNVPLGWLSLVALVSLWQKFKLSALCSPMKRSEGTKLQSFPAANMASFSFCNQEAKCCINTTAKAWGRATGPSSFRLSSGIWPSGRGLISY